jgi:transketolase
VLAASGSEVALAMRTAELLESRAVEAEVVSVPWRERLDAALTAGRYRLPDVPVVWIEAGVPTGWRALAGPRDVVVGIDRFGASGPGLEVAHHLGLSPGDIAGTVLRTLGRTPPCLPCTTTATPRLAHT